ncbi:hypothetical protein [Geodermatophilus sp. SYSU D00684]
MAIVWFTDRDRQDMADAREERRVLDELDRRYTRYVEGSEVPISPRLLRLLETLDLSPRRRAEGEER